MELDQWMAANSFLVVEDIASSRLLVAGILRSLGAGKVQSAASGLEALEKLERARPDVVFCDWMMPGLDGIAVLQEIKRRDPSIKVVMLTAKTDPRERAEASAKGADGYIAKPFSRQSLIDILPQLKDR